ncbi:MAG: 50S ribosomal protein L24 [Planctomycetota bacterium]|nr:50S ribosomal protein L24 [Planctomycetota bacterium]
MRIKADDIVTVISGDGKGQQGKVIRVIPRKGKVVVQNQAYVLKHVRKTQKNPQGGRLQMESPIDISNVRLVCPACSEGTTVVMRKGDDGKRVRVCKKCQEEI